MEEKTLVTYKWDHGIYSLEDLIILVKYHQITPEEFFEITRYNYAVAAQEMEKSRLKKSQT